MTAFQSMRSSSIICLLAISLLAVGSITIVSAAEIGKPHSTVITLKEKNFDDHLNDPANGLWLLKFYAPWCGHCKTLAPVLDAVAPFLAGKMSIGKVDCTTQKALCKRFNVKGYPTMKYYRDGDFQDYPLGRDKDSIITFGEKMSDRAVKIVSTHSEAKEQLLNKIPVAFIVYDPNIASTSTDDSSTIDASGATDAEKAVEKMIQSTELTRVFGQVARKMQAQGSFGLLSPGTTPEEIAKFFNEDDGGATSGSVPSGGFIARIEEDVPIRVFDGEITTDAFTEFAKENNLAVVMELGGHNFRFVSRRGKAMAVAVYDSDDDVKSNKFRKEVKQYAIKGAHKDDYIFAAMDGKKWTKFLSQFSIEKENLPELFVIDVPERTYWQDASVFGVSDFINGVKNGEIESREQEKPKPNPFDEMLQVFVDYMPWSLVLMLALFLAIFWLAMPRYDDNLLHPPPPPPRSVIKVGDLLRPSPPSQKKEDSTGEKVSKKDQ